MRFWGLVIGVFALVFAVTLFSRSADSDEPTTTDDFVDQPPPVGVPVVDDFVPPPPRSAWEINEDPEIRTRRIAGGMTLAAVKAHMRDFENVQFQNVWVYDVLEGPVTASMVCGEVSATNGDQPPAYQAFMAAGTDLTLESDEAYGRTADRFCAPERRIIPIKYGEFEDGGWQGY